MASIGRSARDIKPWYSYVEDFIGVSGQAECLPHLPDRKFLPPMEMNCVELAVKEAIAKKFPDDRMITIGRVAILTQNHRGRAACHYCGPCQRGATLDGWVIRVGELLLPIAGAIGRELLAESYLQADETPVDVQSKDKRGKNHQAYLWQYGSPGGSVVFDFRMGRGREGPELFLGQFGGILQTDGYAAYDKVGGAGIVHAAAGRIQTQVFQCLEAESG